MAFNQTMDKIDEEERKRLQQEEIAARQQRLAADKEAYASLLNPTMDTIRTQMNDFDSKAVPTEGNALTQVPDQYSRQIPDAVRGAKDLWEGRDMNFSQLAPNLEKPEQVSTTVGSPEEQAFEQSTTSKLQRDLEALRANRYVGSDGKTNAPVKAPVAPVSASQDSPYLSPQNQLESQHGLPMGYLSNTAQIESGGNPSAKNPNSTASGLYQFTKGTAEQYGLTDPMNPEASTDAMIRLTKDNQKELTRLLGREPTSGELYLAHQQGAHGAAKLIQNPEMKATDVVGNKAVLNNGGDANMTAQQFAAKWQDRYNGLEGASQNVEVKPLDVPAEPDQRLRRPDGTLMPERNEDLDQDGPIQRAVSNGIPEPTARYMASGQIQFDENGRAVIDSADMGMYFKTDFKHRNREASDSQALWQGLLAGGIAVLGGALAGGNSQDLGALFFLAGADRFSNALGQSARYKNLETLKKQGYSDESLEHYIESGDRSQLKKWEIEDWKEYPGDPTMMYRVRPDGKTDLMKVPAKYNPIELKRGWQTVQRYVDGNGRFKVGEDSKPVEFVLDDGAAAKDEHDRKYASWGAGGKAPSIVNFRTPEGKYVQAYSIGGEYRDVLNPNNPAQVPQGSLIVGDSLVKEDFVAQNKSASSNRDMDRSLSEINLSTQSAKDENGQYKYNAPKQSNKALDMAVQGNWALLGGGRGQLPMLENLMSSGSDKGAVELRNTVNSAINLQGAVRTRAIAAAKAAGASGINTMAEINLFAQSFPPVDYSSYDAMIRSMEHLEKYFDKYVQVYTNKLKETPEVMTGSAGDVSLNVRNGDFGRLYEGANSARQLPEETLNSDLFGGTSSQGNGVSDEDRAALGY